MPRNAPRVVENSRSKELLNYAQNVDPSRLKKLAQMCQMIQTLHKAYIVHGLAPELVGREFFIAVGDILRGIPLEQLEIFHLGGPAN